MKRVALAFLTKDRVELTRQSIEPLLQPDIDLWWMDGSKTEEGQALLLEEGRPASRIRTNVTGGPDSAIVYALTTLLSETNAPHVGIVENDVLLHPDWLGPTLALFERGAADNLLVGAVSTRAYTDRILCQRDGYALMLNLGAGHIVLTRKAAQLILRYYRSQWTTGIVKVFQQLSGIDVRKYWAFRGYQHFTTVDWNFDAMLAAHGLASLALTPSPVEMIGQDPLPEGIDLRLVDKPVELLRNDDAFALFADRTHQIRKGVLRLPDQQFCRLDDGSVVIFPHQVGAIGGQAYGPWGFKWHQGFGPFAYVADQPARAELLHDPTIEVPIAGPCGFMVSGGKTGGRVRLVDTQSGYEIEPDLPPEGGQQQSANLAVPGNVGYRTIRLTALDPGVCFYGIQTSEPQPTDPSWTFDHSSLPKAG